MCFINIATQLIAETWCMHKHTT